MKPQQKIPFKQKNELWVTENIDYIASSAKPIIDKTQATILRRLKSGELDENEYLYVTNPYNFQNARLKNYPARMRNIPIIPEVLNILSGEKTKRFVNYAVSVLNPEVLSLYKQKTLQAVTEYMQEGLNNELYLKGFSVTPSLDEAGNLQKPSPEVITKKVNSLAEQLALMGQQGLNFIRVDAELDEKFVEMFIDVFCLNATVTYKNVNKNEVEFEVVPPEEIKIIKSKRKKYIEDSDAVVRTFEMSKGEIMDMFEGSEDEKKVKDFFSADSEQAEYYKNQSSWAASELWRTLFPNSERFQDEEYKTVEHFVWDSYTKKGMVKGTTVLIGDYEFEVDENYIPTSYETVVWEWVKESWEAYRIDDRLIVGAKPLYPTRGTVDTPLKSRKCYNGLVLEGLSIVQLGMPFQIKHNIYNYYIEKIIGRHRDKVIVMPKSLIPDDEDMDMDDMFYYSDSTGYLMVDDSDKNKLQALQYIKVLDSSLGQTIRELREAAMQNKQEWLELIGINRQRQGKTFSSDLKGVNEQAEYRSAIATEFLFFTLDNLHNRDLNGLLDYSQFAWKDGKRQFFVNSDFKRAFLDIDPELYPFIKMGVYIQQVSNEKESLGMMKGVVQALAQDPNIPKNIIPRLFKANDLNTMIDMLDDVYENLERKMQERDALNSQMLGKEREEEQASKREELEFKYYKTDADNETDERIAGLSVNSKTPQTTEPKENKNSDSLLKEKELYLKSQENNLKLNEVLSKERTERYKADKQLEVAKENKP